MKNMPNQCFSAKLKNGWGFLFCNSKVRTSSVSCTSVYCATMVRARKFVLDRNLWSYCAHSAGPGASLALLILLNGCFQCATLKHADVIPKYKKAQVFTPNWLCNVTGQKRCRLWTIAYQIDIHSLLDRFGRRIWIYADAYWEAKCEWTCSSSFPTDASHYCTRVRRVNSCESSHWWPVNQ